jgi:hypothetical protein
MTCKSARLDFATTCRQRARQAEAEAQKATNGAARDVFIAVAVAWRGLALDSGRRAKRLKRDRGGN